MKKLLVAFDGSESALRALRHAITLAQGDRAEIHLVIAHETPVLYPDIGLTVSYDTLLVAQRAHAAEVLEEGETLLRGGSVPYSTEVLMGEIGSVIAERADALGCDGIVMGTRGMGAVRNLVLGSVATKVVHAAHVPVTLVK